MGRRDAESAGEVTFPDWPTELAWIQTQMPIRITFGVAVATDDEWVRAYIRGEDVPLPALQHVIVQGTRERDRIVDALANLKMRRGLPYGGAMSHRESLNGQ